VTVGYGCCVYTLGDPPDPVYWGFRQDLAEGLTARGLLVSLVGRCRDGAFAESYHEGYPGYATHQLQSQVATTLGPLRPDLVVLMAGTNDALQQQTSPEQSAEMLLSITTVLTTTITPPPAVLVSTIPPCYGYEAWVAAYNALLPGVAELQRSYGRRVTFVDACGGLSCSDLADGIHPNASAYEWIAAALVEAAAEILGGSDAVF
jgi:lysophospholipase L1-like esterase